MTFKIIHLVNDEKFIHFIAEMFNTCEGVTNQFIVIVPDTSEPLKLVSGLTNMAVIDKSFILSGDLKRDIASCSAVIVHYLDPTKAMIALRLPKHVPVVWSGWGADYYDYIAKSKGSLLSIESALLHTALTQPPHTTPSTSKIIKKVHIFIRSAIKSLIFNRFLCRVNYFSAPIPEDYDLLASSLSGRFKAEYIQINYGSVDKTFTPGPTALVGDDILVGNSAHISNNHLEVFRLLSRLDLKGRRIIVPLSYGKPDYREVVISRGYEYFGDAFHPLVDFMPIDQYNNLIAKCSVVIMGHIRQQAVGNTATMLYKGAKVYLDETSTVYHFFKSRGAFISGLEELNKNSENMFLPLSGDQRTKNKEVLKAFWGDDIVRNNTHKLVELLKTASR